MESKKDGEGERGGYGFKLEKGTLKGPRIREEETRGTKWGRKGSRREGVTSRRIFSVRDQESKEEARNARAKGAKGLT